MNRISASCLVLCLAAAQGRAQQPLAKQDELQKAKILFIGADNRSGNSHVWMHTCEVLAKAVRRTPGIETMVSNGWPKDFKSLEGVRALVVYSPPAGDHLLQGAGRNQFHELMKQDVGFATIHYASSIGKGGYERNGPTWLRYTGGTWVVLPVVGLSGGKSQLMQMEPKHPICRGWKEFEIDDEYYLDPVIDKATPLLKVTERKGKDVVVGWVHVRPEGGRTFSTTLGHFYKNFQDERFRRMIVNGILWSARIDVPASGAPVDLSDEDLAPLPTEPKKK
jgi:type 1 glutamine amidotransferase